MPKYLLSFQRLLALALQVTLTACAAGLSGSTSDTWREEVLLHDEQKIVVDRSQTYGSGREIGQGLPVKELSIAFRVPRSGKQLKWTSEFSEGIGIAELKLAALHVLEETPYIVALPNCNSYSKFGRPNPPYVLLKNEGGKWIRITMAELPKDFKDTNLVVDSLGNSGALVRQGKVSADMVKQLNEQMAQPENRSIVREQMTPHQGVTNCSIPSAIDAKLIAPEIHGQPIYYNWWPLAKDWMRETYHTVD